MQQKIFCISGIDTDIGKTIATGLMAKALKNSGVNVITQKFVQTGCEGISEDIIRHREIMGCGLLEVDKDLTTCPYVFRVPCSPHLAARLDGRKILIDRIASCMNVLTETFELVLLEGAGGLLVPVSEETTFLDYIQAHKLPVILVTSSRLGSINHTLASFDILSRRGITLAGVIYNHDPETDRRITIDTKDVIFRFLAKYSFCCPVVDLVNLDYYDTMEKMTEYLQIFNDK